MSRAGGAEHTLTSHTLPTSTATVAATCWWSQNDAFDGME